MHFTSLAHPEVRIEVTNFCNAACLMCPREKLTRSKGILSFDRYRKILEEAATIGCQQVVLTGFGEPLLDLELENKILLAKQLGLRTYIITNASRLDFERAESLMGSGIDEIRISFYGMTEATYRSVMVGLDFNATKQNIERFLDLRAISSVQTPKVQINFLELSENEDETQEFLEYWEPKVDAVEVWRPHNFGSGRSYRSLTGEKRSCGRPNHGPLQIQWDGAVVACCFDFNNALVLGNIFRQSILEILNGNPYKAIRKAHEQNRFDEFPYCDQCDQLISHSDAFAYSNRHKLSGFEAVQLSNTDLHNLVHNRMMDPSKLTLRYRGEKDCR